MKFLLTLCCLLVLQFISAQPPQANYLESAVPDYTLPDPLVFGNGQPVRSIQDWKRRRAALYALFETEVYGRAPVWKGSLNSTVISEKTNALEGQALRREIRLTLKNGNKELELLVLMYLPLQKTGVPVFLGCNFYGNQTISAESDLKISTAWVRNNPDFGITENKGTAASRGVRTSRWPIRDILATGCGLVSLYYGDIDPDFDDGFKNGVHGLYPENPRDSTSWGSIAAWAWGLSRVMDYLETDTLIDADRVILMGHSRLGKAALWAAASDPRFAAVVSNNSGCGGAALSKRVFGETVGSINRAFPHWFNLNFRNTVVRLK